MHSYSIPIPPLYLFKNQLRGEELILSILTSDLYVKTVGSNRFQALGAKEKKESRGLM